MISSVAVCKRQAAAAARFEFQKCADDVQTWLSSVESQMRDLLLPSISSSGAKRCVVGGHDDPTGFHQLVEGLHALLVAVEGGAGQVERLRELFARCRDTSFDGAAAHTLCDGLCQRYNSLTCDLKVR